MEVQLKKRMVRENELTMQVLKTKELNVAAYARVSMLVFLPSMMIKD